MSPYFRTRTRIRREPQAPAKIDRWTSFRWRIAFILSWLHYDLPWFVNGLTHYVFICSHRGHRIKFDMRDRCVRCGRRMPEYTFK